MPLPELVLRWSQVLARWEETQQILDDLRGIWNFYEPVMLAATDWLLSSVQALRAVAGL